MFETGTLSLALVLTPIVLPPRFRAMCDLNGIMHFFIMHFSFHYLST